MRPRVFFFLIYLIRVVFSTLLSIFGNVKGLFKFSCHFSKLITLTPIIFKVILIIITVKFDIYMPILVCSDTFLLFGSLLKWFEYVQTRPCQLCVTEVVIWNKKTKTKFCCYLLFNNEYYMILYTDLHTQL